MKTAPRHPVSQLFAVLANDNRLRILNTLNLCNGWVSTGTLSAQTGLTPEATRAHLRQLARAGLIHSASNVEGYQGYQHGGECHWHRITVLAQDLVARAVRDTTTAPGGR